MLHEIRSLWINSINKINSIIYSSQNLICQMWWMVLIHKTEIWFKPRDIDIFRNCVCRFSRCIRSSVRLCIEQLVFFVFFIFKLILYVCNLLSKWDEYLFLIWLFFRPALRSKFIKQKRASEKKGNEKRVYCLARSCFITVIVCSFHGSYFDRSSLFVHYFVRIFVDSHVHSQRWLQKDMGFHSFCGLRCTYLIILSKTMQRIRFHAAREHKEILE